MIACSFGTGSHVAAVAALSLCLWTAPADAQSGRGEMEQVDAVARGVDAPMSQISVEPERILMPPRPAPASTTVSPQLSVQGDADPAPPQLTSETGALPAPRQLYVGGRTAQPSEALSRPSEGRTGAVSPVGGRDRCDAAEAAEQGRVCDRVIETRSAEFARPDPGRLSPEQRLLIDQQLREAPSGARNATRRLGSAGFEPESIEEQGVASIAMRGQSVPATPGDDADDPSPADTDAAVQAILGIITQVPQQ